MTSFDSIINYNSSRPYNEFKHLEFLTIVYVVLLKMSY